MVMAAVVRSGDGFIRDGFSIHTDGGVARVLIDRPERRNALTQRMWATLAEVVLELQSRPNIRLIIFGSTTPGIFSAGADVTEYREHAEDLQWSAASQKVVAAALETLSACSCPTIAAIDGPCFGGGAGISVACDFRIATVESSFAITPAKLGMVYPYTATVSLVNLVGARHAKRILFTGETFTAQTAYEMGFLDRVVPQDDFVAQLDDFIAPLLSTSGTSVRLMKQAITWITDGDRTVSPRTDALVEEALQSPDYQEGIMSFLERRAPRF